jgi:hypothetical protein
MTDNLRLVSTRHSRCGDGVRESRRECSGGGGGAPLQNALCCWSSLGPVSVQFGPVWSSFGDWSVLVGPPWPVLAIGRSWLVRHGHGWFSGWSAARGWVYFLNRARTKSEPTTLAAGLYTRSLLYSLLAASATRRQSSCSADGRQLAPLAR